MPRAEPSDPVLRPEKPSEIFEIMFACRLLRGPDVPVVVGSVNSSSLRRNIACSLLSGAKQRHLPWLLAGVERPITTVTGTTASSHQPR